MLAILKYPFIIGVEDIGCVQLLLEVIGQLVIHVSDGLWLVPVFFGFCCGCWFYLSFRLVNGVMTNEKFGTVLIEYN